MMLADNQAADLDVVDSSTAGFLLRPRTWLRIFWVAIQLSAALLLANKVDPFFYQGF